MSYYTKNKDVIKKSSAKRYEMIKDDVEFKKHRKEYAKKYRQDIKYDIRHWYSKIYRAMNYRNKIKFGLELLFTLDEFKLWINENYKEKIVEMYNEYIESGFDKYKSPSIDRIDDYKPYTFDNMQLLTWKENDIKGSLCLKNKKSMSKTAKEYWSKEVFQFDLYGNFINSFTSIREAGRQCGLDSSSISKVCKKLLKQCGGYTWRYANE